MASSLPLGIGLGDVGKTVVDATVGRAVDLFQTVLSEVVKLGLVPLLRLKNPADSAAALQAWDTSLEIALTLFPVLVAFGVVARITAADGSGSFWRLALRAATALFLIAVSKPAIGMSVDMTNAIVTRLAPATFTLEFGIAEYSSSAGILIKYYMGLIASGLIGAAVLLCAVLLLFRHFLIYLVFIASPLLAVFWLVDWGFMDPVNAFAAKVSRMGTYTLLSGVLVAIALRVSKVILGGGFVTGSTTQHGEFFMQLAAVFMVPIALVAITWKAISWAGQPVGMDQAAGQVMTAGAALAGGAIGAAGGAGGAASGASGSTAASGSTGGTAAVSSTDAATAVGEAGSGSGLSGAVRRQTRQGVTGARAVTAPGGGSPATPDLDPPPTEGGALDGSPIPPTADADATTAPDADEPGDSASPASATPAPAAPATDKTDDGPGTTSADSTATATSPVRQSSSAPVAVPSSGTEAAPAADIEASRTPESVARPSPAQSASPTPTTADAPSSASSASASPDRTTAATPNGPSGAVPEAPTPVAALDDAAVADGGRVDLAESTQYHAGGAAGDGVLRTPDGETVGYESDGGPALDDGEHYSIDGARVEHAPADAAQDYTLVGDDETTARSADAFFSGDASSDDGGLRALGASVTDSTIGSLTGQSAVMSATGASTAVGGAAATAFPEATQTVTSLASQPEAGAAAGVAGTAGVVGAKLASEGVKSATGSVGSYVTKQVRQRGLQPIRKRLRGRMQSLMDSNIQWKWGDRGKYEKKGKQYTGQETDDLINVGKNIRENSGE
jgi:hypothetical protein